MQEEKCVGNMALALPGWQVITNYKYNPLGNIWFCWNEDVVVTLLHKSDQIITCAVQKPVSWEQFICSTIYAFNLMGERRQLWEDISAARKLPMLICRYLGYCLETIMLFLDI